MTTCKITVAGHDEVAFEPEGAALSGVLRPLGVEPLRAHLVDSGTQGRLRPPREIPGPASIPQDRRRPRCPDPRGGRRTTPWVVPACRRHSGSAPHGRVSRRAPSSLRRAPEGGSTLPPGRRRALEGAGTQGVSERIGCRAASTEDLAIGARPVTIGSLDPQRLRATGPLVWLRAGDVDRAPGAGAGSCPGARAHARRSCRGRAHDARRGPRRSRGGERRARRGR